MTHRVQPGQQPAQQIGVPHVTDHQLMHAAIPGHLPAMRLRQQRVQKDDLMPPRLQRIRDVRPDEPRPTGNQNPHPATL
jgi:hypothetical protein